jgi:hypothetical protein
MSDRLTSEQQEALDKKVDDAISRYLTEIERDGISVPQFVASLGAVREVNQQPVALSREEQIRLVSQRVDLGWPATPAKGPGERGPKHRLTQYAAALARRRDLCRRLVKLPGLRKGDGEFTEAVLVTAISLVAHHVTRSALATQVWNAIAADAGGDDPIRVPSTSQVRRILSAVKKARLI